MPLYTCVLSMNGAAHVSQVSFSNLRGSLISWVSEVPTGAVPGFTAGFKRKFTEALIRANPVPVANLDNVWEFALTVEDTTVVIHAVQTQRA